MSKKTRAERNLKFETLQLHVGQENPDPATGARAVPIYQTSSFVFNNSDHAAARFGLQDAGNIYGRLTNPTEDVFEQRMAALEGGVAALAVASGAAAINYTIINLAQKGDHIVSAKNIYGGSYNLLAHTLPQYGISTTFVDVFDLDEVRAAVQENTKAIYIETLGNPNSDVVDIEALAKIAHENKIPLVVDNTFATPYLVRPIEYGADIVVHSATKFIGGHGTTLGGVIVDSGKFDWEGSGKFASLTEPNPSYHGISFTKAVGPAAFVTKVRAILLRDTGATLSPFNSFLLLQGLETLSLRVERHVENALKVVQYLNDHPQVEKVHHPSVSTDPSQQELYKKYFPNGGGSIFTFEIKGDAQKAKDFIDNLELFSLLANVADVKSLVNLIESAKKLLDGNYTSDSMKDLKAAIKKAEDVIANPNRTEAEIGTAYADLINAILNLHMKANKAALKAILDKANEVLGNADAYVAATIAGLDAAAAEAQTVYDNTDALQDDVDAAVRALTRKVADARLLGDVDNDGEVTTADSAALLAASAEITSLDADAAAAADVNGDDVADTNDAVLILQYAVEKVASF